MRGSYFTKKKQTNKRPDRAVYTYIATMHKSFVRLIHIYCFEYCIVLYAVDPTFFSIIIYPRLPSIQLMTQLIQGYKPKI